MSNKKKNKVMVFGVFDQLHEGHRKFLGVAGSHGGKLIAVVARDDTVQLLKQKVPVENEGERMRRVGALAEVAQVELGDAALGAYTVIKKYQPDVICLGYDQQALADDLKMRMASGEISVIRLVRLQAHEPERLHTSLLTEEIVNATI